jgi:hypothetical protein
MAESLIEVKVIKSGKKKDRCGLTLDCSWNKYISKNTVAKVKSTVENIYNELPEEVILLHQIENIPIFNLKEESTGIYLEGSCVGIMQNRPEYKNWLDSFIYNVKRDYVAFCINKKNKKYANA